MTTLEERIAEAVREIVLSLEEINYDLGYHDAVKLPVQHKARSRDVIRENLYACIFELEARNKDLERKLEVARDNLDVIFANASDNDLVFEYADEALSFIRTPTEEAANDSGEVQGELTEDTRLTRFEVIDHRLKGRGRVFMAFSAVELSLQDDGQTLKVFLRDATPHPTPAEEAGQ